MVLSEWKKGGGSDGWLIERVSDWYIVSFLRLSGWMSIIKKVKEKGPPEREREMLHHNHISHELNWNERESGNNTHTHTHIHSGNHVDKTTATPLCRLQGWLPSSHDPTLSCAVRTDNPPLIFIVWTDNPPLNRVFLFFFGPGVFWSESKCFSSLITSLFTGPNPLSLT